MDYKDLILKKYIGKEVEEYKKRKDLIQKTDYYNSYIEITKKLVKTLRKMCIYNPIEVKIVYEYLLYNGYLSIDKKFKFGFENRVENNFVPGINIMRGTGTCLNISDLLKDIYKLYGFNSEIVTCKINYTDEEQNKRLLKEWSYLTRFVFENIVGSHAITLVNNNGSTFLCDATNKDFININRNLNGKYLKNEFIVKILPHFFGLIKDNKKELNNLLKQSQKLNCEEVNKIDKGIHWFLECQEKELNNFHESIKSNIEIICKRLK